MIDSLIAGLCMVGAGVSLLWTRRWATGIAGLLLAIAGGAVAHGGWEGAVLVAVLLVPALAAALFVYRMLLAKQEGDVSEDPREP